MAVIGEHHITPAFAFQQADVARRDPVGSVGTKTFPVMLQGCNTVAEIEQYQPFSQRGDHSYVMKLRLQIDNVITDLFGNQA